MNQRLLGLWIAVFMPVVALAGDGKNELTGVFHRAVSKNPAYLEIDGAGFISRIIVTGREVKEVADGKRIWVRGTIKTSLYGSPDQTKQDNQQTATQWFIVFHVEQFRLITTPFERPEGGDQPQNKPPEGTR